VKFLPAPCSRTCKPILKLWTCRARNIKVRVAAHSSQRKLLLALMMNQGNVVLVGSLPIGHLALDHLIAEFGWTLQEADGLRNLAELSVDHNLEVVLFSPKHLVLPWEQALRAVLDAAPRALPILCHTFGEPIDWQQAADAGVFHSLPVPFDAREVRQSLGFAWAAKRRPAPVRMPRRSGLRRVMRERTSRMLVDPSAIVA
jgi:hypothetical protein